MDIEPTIYKLCMHIGIAVGLFLFYFSLAEYGFRAIKLLYRRYKNKGLKHSSEIVVKSTPSK